MLIVSLNIRGLGGGTKTRYLRRIIASEGAKLVCLQETKTTVITYAKCFALWGDNKIGWIHNEGDNGGGSLLTMWHKDALCYESHVIGKGFIAVSSIHLSSARRCVIVNIYSACVLRDKKLLWEELTNIKVASQELVWCLCGDFNAIRSRRERKGASVRGDTPSGHSSEINGFNRFIESNLLLNLPIIGKKSCGLKQMGQLRVGLIEFLSLKSG